MQTPMHHHNQENRYVQHFPKLSWTPVFVFALFWMVKILNLSFTFSTFFSAQYCIVSSWCYVAKQITRIVSPSITESLCPLNSSFLPPATLAIAIVFSTTMNFTTLDTSYMWSHELSFCKQVFSLSLMPSRSIHPITNSRNFFFLKVEQHSFTCIYTLFSLPIHMSIDNWIISISWLFVNNAAINMDMMTSIQYPYFNSLDIPKVEFPDHMVILILLSWEMPILFPQLLYYFIIHFQKECTRIPISLHLCQLLLSFIFIIATLTGVQW